MSRHAHPFWHTLIIATTGLVAAAVAWSQEPISTDPATQTLQRVSPDERIRLDWDRGVDNLKITDLEGRDITAEAQPRQEPNQVSLAPPQRQPFVVKSEQIETRRLMSEERQPLPDGLFIPPTDEVPEVIVPPGMGGTPLPPLPPRPASWLRLTLAASPMPATWNPLSGTYHTELSFGVHPSDDLLDPAFDLERPVEVRVGLRGLTANPAPPPLRIEAPGLAHEKTMVLDFLPSTPTPTLEVRSTLSDVDLELEALPRLEVRPESTSMVGFGLARMAVGIEQVAPHGAPLRATHPTLIALTVDGPATPDPHELRLEPDQSKASFNLRSSGLAPLTITAAAGNVSGQAIIEQHVPWGPIIAALAGGALGGFGRRFVKGARRAQTTRRLLEGVIVALIAYVAAVLGIGYLGLPAPVAATEAGAFLTGALTGFIGVNVLEILSRPGRLPAG